MRQSYRRRLERATLTPLWSRNVRSLPSPVPGEVPLQEDPAASSDVASAPKGPRRPVCKR
ncbi:hypothetical protein FKM82_006974 [Ascaphus truei]